MQVFGAFYLQLNNPLNNDDEYKKSDNKTNLTHHDT